MDQIHAGAPLLCGSEKNEGQSSVFDSSSFWGGSNPRHAPCACQRYAWAPPSDSFGAAPRALPGGRQRDRAAQPAERAADESVGRGVHRQHAAQQQPLAGGRPRGRGAGGVRGALPADGPLQRHEQERGGGERQQARLLLVRPPQTGTPPHPTPPTAHAPLAPASRAPACRQRRHVLLAV